MQNVEGFRFSSTCLFSHSHFSAIELPYWLVDLYARMLVWKKKENRCVLINWHFSTSLRVYCWWALQKQTNIHHPRDLWNEHKIHFSNRVCSAFHVLKIEWNANCSRPNGLFRTDFYSNGMFVCWAKRIASIFTGHFERIVIRRCVGCCIFSYRISIAQKRRTRFIVINKQWT